MGIPVGTSVCVFIVTLYASIDAYEWHWMCGLINWSLQEVHDSLEKGRQAGMADTFMQSTFGGAHRTQGAKEPSSLDVERTPSEGHMPDAGTTGGERSASARSRTLFAGGDGEHMQGSHQTRQGSEAAAPRSSQGQAESSSSGASAQSAAGAATAAKKGTQQPQQQQQQQGKKKEKVKEVFFGPKIAHHDIEVRLKKARQWLMDGLK